MSLFAGASILSTVEPILLGVGFLAFLRARAYVKFPAFGAYLSCRLGIYAILSVLLYAVHSGSMEKHLAYSTYYYVYWIGYLAGAGAAFLVIQEVFSHTMEAISGIRHLGIIAFRWVTLISVLISVAVAIYPAGLKQNLLIAATSGLMRCIGILELCLLAFIVLSMRTLRIPLRSRDFGIALGLGMVAAAELFGSAFAFGHSTLASLANYASQIVVTLAAAVWSVYFVAPELDREPIALPESSPLARWYEIARALDEPRPVSMVFTGSDFFLQDVEKAVDKVLEKNFMNGAG
jgi:hypothetical protein